MSDVTRVAVVGAAGRMGSTVCDAVDDAPDLELVGRYDAGDDLGDLGGADVAVDFTIPAVSPTTVAHCVAAGVSVVVGTTGWTEERLGRLREQVAAAPEGTNALVAPNFAIGAVLMMAFAEKAAPYYESVEIIELHHPNKVDAPSGTAARTADLVAAARREAGLGDVPDATAENPLGTRGGRVDGIPVHSVRLRGLVAHQEVLLGNEGEMLTIRHDTVDRVSFMPGVLAGIRGVRSHPGVTVGLEHYLGI